MIALVDYGMGNLQSVRNACEHLGYRVTLASVSSDLREAERIILPGVGAFSEGMRRLKEKGLDLGLRDEVMVHRKPLLGICLGMQLLADWGTEGGETAGLGLIPGKVERLQPGGLRLPHIGWNEIKLEGKHPVFDKDLEVDYYFVHSYFFKAENRENVIAQTQYGSFFPSVVGKGSALGVQFHPEKSHRFGLELLRRFLVTC